MSESAAVVRADGSTPRSSAWISLLAWPLLWGGLFLADGLAHLRLSVIGFFTHAVLAGGGYSLAWAAARRRCSGWVNLGLGGVGIAAGLGVAGIVISKGGFSAGQVLWLAATLSLGSMLWLCILNRLSIQGVGRLGEAARWTIVSGAVLWVLSPFVSDWLVGGTDARWYAYSLADFVNQLRSGVFPVFIGQGEHAWNGAVHPFRSAPAYMHVAGLWDALTFHTLPFVALQHFHALFMGLVLAGSTYVATVLLAPSQRWLGCGFSVLAILCPALLACLYNAEMYMTWSAIAVLPWVVYGNLRAIREDRAPSYAPLAAALAALWMCHAPVAVQATFVSVCFQSLWLAFRPFRVACLWAVLRGAGLFALLGVFYFYSVSEVPSQHDYPVRQDLLSGAGLMVGLYGIIRGVILGQRLWMLALAPSAVILWTAHAAWFWWMIGMTAFTALVLLTAQGRGRVVSKERGFDVCFLSALASAALVQVYLGADYGGYEQGFLQLHRFNANLNVDYLRPLNPHQGALGDYQLGYALIVAWLGLFVAAFRSRRLDLRFVMGTTFLIGIAIFHVPLVSEFFVGSMPKSIGRLSGFPLYLRVLPGLALWTVFGGFMALAAWRQTGWSRTVTLVGLAIAVAWSAWQAQKFVLRGHLVSATRGQTRNLFRDDVAVQERFNYDLLQLPTTFSHGKTDPRLETRLLDRQGNVLVGPDEIAARMEEAGVETVTVFSTSIAGSPDWVGLEPGFTVGARETHLLRFEFGPYAFEGWLFFHYGVGQRVYILPDSGLPEAFGVGAGRSKILSIWNSGGGELAYRLEFQRRRESTVPDEGEVMRVHVSRYDPARSPIELRSYSPLQWRVTTDQPAVVETFRSWIPGYEARVNDTVVPSFRSPRGLLALEVPAGTHEVELRYKGTTRLWGTWWASLLSWSAIVVFGVWRLWRWLLVPREG